MQEAKIETLSTNIGVCYMPDFCANAKLAQTNPHERDLAIRFYDKDHHYDILTDPNKKYMSVTTFVHGHFPHFNPAEAIAAMKNGSKWNPTHKCWGMTDTQIRALWSSTSVYGTKLHAKIEEFMNSGETGLETHGELLDAYNKNPDMVVPIMNTKTCTNIDISKEWQYFLNYLADTRDMLPFRTEWYVYNEKHELAGSIDMVYKDPKTNKYHIYDWKRCTGISSENLFCKKYATNPLIGEIPDTKYWHYSIQLNTYKRILEETYGIEIETMVLVQIHPENENYALHPVPNMKEEIDLLFKERYAHLAIAAATKIEDNSIYDLSEIEAALDCH